MLIQDVTLRASMIEQYQNAMLMIDRQAQLRKDKLTKSMTDMAVLIHAIYTRE